MKKLINSLLILLASSLALCIQAQNTIPDLTPDNVTEVTDLIFELHGAEIDEEYSNVLEFLENLIVFDFDYEYDATCSPPIAELINITNNGLYYEWEPSSNATASLYKVSYMKLNPIVAAASETNYYETPNTNLQFNPSDGLMVVVFQSVCGGAGATGSGGIIIVDKPVFFGDGTRDCECQTPNGLPELSFVGLDNSQYDVVSTPFTHEGNVGVYKGAFKFDNDNIAEFLIEMSTQVDGTIIIRKGRDCMINMHNDSGGSVMYVMEDEIDGASYGTLMFNNNLFSFNPLFGVAGTLSIDMCDTGKGKRSSNSEKAFSNKNSDLMLSFPNPVKSTISLQIPEVEESEPYSFSIVDVFGKSIPLNGNASTASKGGNMSFNVNHLPVGSYVLIAQNKKRTLKSRFVKVN